MKQEFYRIRLGVTNCYLLRCKEGYLLIDTCYSDTYLRFLKALDKKKINVGEIRYLLLTHHHEDHAGFAAKLAEDTGCRIIAHEKALQHLINGRSSKTMKPLNRRVRFAFALFRLLRREAGYPPVFLTDREMIIAGDNGTILRKLGIDGEILETPGHTGDSISVLLADGSLFAGDAAMNILKPCGVKHRPIYAESFEEALQSLEKVTANGARMVYPAHGRPFTVDAIKIY